MEFTIVYDKATKDVKINGVEFQYETAKKLTTQKFNQVLSRMGGCVEISRKGAVQFFRGCLPCDNCRI